MWKIKQIFDGDFGCEDHPEDEETMVTVYLENEIGGERAVRIADSLLTAKGLSEGSVWPPELN